MSNIVSYQHPGLDELQAIQMQADVLAATQFIPQAYRNKPGDIIAASLIGREMGWAPIVSLQRIIVIDGKPTIDAQGMVGLVRAQGHSLMGEDLVDKDGNYAGTKVTGKRLDGDTMEFSFTLADARTAGLLPAKEKSAWAKYPKAMCWARAVSQVCRMLFADVMLGISYTPEEMGSVVDSAPAPRRAQAPAVSDPVKAALPPSPLADPAAPTAATISAQDETHVGPSEPVEGEVTVTATVAVEGTVEPADTAVTGGMTDIEREETLGELRLLVDKLEVGAKDELKKWLKTEGIVWRRMDAEQVEAVSGKLEELAAVPA